MREAFLQNEQHKVKRFSCAGLPRVCLCLLVPFGIFAQLPSLLTTPQSRTGETGTSAILQQGQSRACTPAEYGDPAADCVPMLGRQPVYGADPYGQPSQTGALPFGYDNSPLVTNDSRGRDLATESASGAMARPSPSNYVPPEPLTEFQRYVADNTGQLLPIFGASLFERMPATFAPLDRSPVGPDYVIAPGDELQISVWGQFNFSRRLIVDRLGEITLPDAGPISVSGMTYLQAAAVFKAALTHFYKNFELNVTLGRLHSIQIFAVGEARRPGSYSVSSLSTLVNAIFASGGPSARGSMRSIQLRRRDQTVRDFDMYDLLTLGDKSKDAPLSPGDVIFIPPAGPRVAVAGSVEHPGIYELKAKGTIAEVLRLADGLTPLASRRQVLLERVADDAGFQIIRVPMTSGGLQTELKNGDIVRLLPVVPRFNETVALRGNVVDPGKFPWHSGMRVSDVIPDKEQLLTRDYWTKRNSLSSNRTRTLSNQTDPDSGQSAAGGQPISSDSEAAMYHPPGNSGQASFREQNRNTQGDSSLGSATSLDNVPPLRSFVPQNLVQQLAPDINWEYATVERIDTITLATRVIPFNLGKVLLNHDSAQDLALEPGDIITVFSQADFSVPLAQQLKQVRLEGEIAMAGVYTIAPGESLRQVIERAGGLTTNAYLYGVQFTRESTRREQQKRYDDFLNQFEREVNEAAANLSSRVTSPQQAATAQTSLVSQRELIDRLKKISMNGRIVLDMAPNSRGIRALPDLALENGDRLFVPPKPATVNVIGTVFEQAAFLYEDDLRIGDYLKKAGGSSRSADRSHMFVVRADGSVVSRSTGNVLFARSFENLEMHPGDALVVPTVINKPTFIRNLIDWSQVFSNFALGAAAVNILH